MACPKKKVTYSKKKNKYNINSYLKLNRDEILRIRRWSDYYEYNDVAFKQNKKAIRYSIQLAKEDEFI